MSGRGDRSATAGATAPTAPRTEPAVTTDGTWFGPAERPLLGWLSHARRDVIGSSPAAVPASGIVILAPVGYAYWCSHRTLRAIAERLAARGHAVLRFDYDGTGDSAGDQWEQDRVPTWRANVRAAVEELRQRGCRQITLVGARLGATFALLDGPELGADRVVAWAPIGSGRRYVKELKLLSTPVPKADDPLEPAGTVVAAGTVFSAETLTALGALTLAELTDAAARTLVVDDPGGSAQAVVDRLASLGGEAEHVTLGGGELALETPPEFAAVPAEIVEAIIGWIGDAEPLADAQRPPRPGARIAWRGGEVDEEIVRLEPHGHVGIATSPLEVDPARSTLVMLNPGSETHVGPGRAWVEYARALALLGHRSVRVDLRGWGESPDDGRAPGRPYDACGIDDAAEIVRSLRASGHERVVLFGLCASAWILLRTVLDAQVTGAIALNPQMYWQQGDPVEIDWDLIRARRAAEIRRIEGGARWHAWSALDLVGSRPFAGRWLDELAETRIPIELLFAEGDDGIVFLRGRLSRRLSRVTRDGAIAVREIPDVDHPMHRTWLRQGIIDAIHDALDRIDGTG